MTTDAELSPNADHPAETNAVACGAHERDLENGSDPMDGQWPAPDLSNGETAVPASLEGTFPTSVVEHVSNVLESFDNRPFDNGHVENVPHVGFGFSSESSEVSDTELSDEDELSDEELSDQESSEDELSDEELSDTDSSDDEELSDDDSSDEEVSDDALPDEDESLIERLRDWLVEVRAEADEASDWSDVEDADVDEADVEFDAPGPGLLRLVEEFTALRHDVKLQAKSARGVQEQAGELLAGLARAIEQFQSVAPREQQAARAAVRPLLEALAELDVAFDRGRVATETSRRRWLDADSGLWRETIAAELRSLSWWQRLCLGTLTARLSHALHEQAERACTATFDAQLDGYRLVQNRLRRLLVQHDVERLETVGRLADPNRMTIVEVADRDDVPEGTVLDELRPGYVWHGEVLRFAEVRVARGRREE